MKPVQRQTLPYVSSKPLVKVTNSIVGLKEKKEVLEKDLLKEAFMKRKEQRSKNFTLQAFQRKLRQKETENELFDGQAQQQKH